MSLTYNWGIVGHDKALRALEGDIQSNNLVHAYLFAGPSSVGKYTAAKKLTHILQCEKGFCEECDTCREIDKGFHSDTIEMDDEGESVKIEQIRKVLERLNMTRQSPHKIFLVKNIERMTLEASNALLKSLEDPVEGTVFLLTTSRVKEILSTILSRVRVVNFGRLSEGSMAELIQKHYPLAEKESLDTVRSLALGRPGKALALLEDSEMYDTYKKMYSDIEMFLRKPDRTDQFVYINELVSSAKEEKGTPLHSARVSEFLDVFQLVLRKQLLMDIDFESAILPREKILLLLRYIQKSREYLKYNVNTRLLLENMMLLL